MRLLLFFLLIFPITSVWTFGQSENQYLLTLKKGACLGECPVFQIQVTHEGTFTYQGVVFTEKKGKWSRQLTSRELKTLKRIIRKARLHRIEGNHGMDIMDAPLTTITAEGKKGHSKVAYKGEQPGKIALLEEYLMSLFDEAATDESQWTVTEPAYPTENRRMASSTVIVEFKSTIEIPQWVKQYGEYDLELIRPISSVKPIFLFGYNETKIHQPGLINILQRDTAVLHAEPNLKIKLRN